MDKNHIHLLSPAHPKISPGKRYPQIKQDLWGVEFWSDGYYAATVGDRGNWSQVEKYVQKQGKPKEDLKQIRLF